ncbi:MAG: glycoside hydrolase family 95 protein [Cytophagales bacterium]|nr:glycoside hydrolase family 95 protein [Cytophagales bacterium]
MLRILCFFLLYLFFSVSCTIQQEKAALRLWYDKPAETWTEALPVGNGRLGAMVFGTVAKEHIQFNEETLWTGRPNNYANQGAVKYLDDIRRLLFEGKQEEAHKLSMEKFMSIPLTQMEYQPFGDLYIEFDGHDKYTDYHRQLDLTKAVSTVIYKVDGTTYTREIISSNPHEVVAIRLSSDKKGALDFRYTMDAEHEVKEVSIKDRLLSLEVKVKDGVLQGLASIKLETDGTVETTDRHVIVTNATKAALYLTASTNYKNYKDVSKDAEEEITKNLAAIAGLSYDQLLKEHIADYTTLFERFNIDLGSNARDSLPTNRRIIKFNEDPNDPGLIALYVQYGRYLLISSSREGTNPPNLQGIWNKDLKPAWGSKYTTNINAEMNYWLAEVLNLSECHEPLFALIEDCSASGAIVAREHYGADGWVVHHNTDIWRGTAPINHSNHGIFAGGGAWLATHLWEHYLYTQDKDFLKNRAYPLMKGAAKFFTQFLIEDPETGWLISTPSNSPETGGLVAGPTMDHQIIRHLFRACIKANEVIGGDDEFASLLSEMIPKIAPNQIGQYGQLQEWMEDNDDPQNKHRHVSHLWGMHPGNDFNWDTAPELMEAARKSLEMRGDDGTGWSLAWKINFWARLLDGNRAYKLIKMMFRPVAGTTTRYDKGGGSYPNLFDAHPPFQIDGNFGAPAGIIEMLMQSHMGRIDILPALPKALPEGKIVGLKARGGFELAFSWKNGELTELEILSAVNNTCKVKYNNKWVELPLVKGQRLKLNGDLEKI